MWGISLYAFSLFSLAPPLAVFPYSNSFPTSLRIVLMFQSDPLLQIYEITGFIPSPLYGRTVLHDIGIEHQQAAGFWYSRAHC
jgi:hypothetical protein